MRPPEFTGGNERRRSLCARDLGASMRPPEFTGGNQAGGTLDFVLDAAETSDGGRSTRASVLLQ